MLPRLPSDLSGYEPVKRMQAGLSGYGLFTRDDDDGIFDTRYEPLPRYGWGVLVEQPHLPCTGALG